MLIMYSGLITFIVLLKLAGNITLTWTDIVVFASLPLLYHILKRVIDLGFALILLGIVLMFKEEKK